MGELVSAVEAAVADYRRSFHYEVGRGTEWRVVLPAWLVFHGGRTLEQYCAEFEESVKRMAGLPLGRMVGFETEVSGGVYRYTLACYREDSPETTSEDATA